MKRLLKIIATIIGLLVVLLIVVLLFISPIAEDVIEKNSEQHTGRRIQMEKLWINILSGRITINKLPLPEANHRDTFLFVHYLEVNLKQKKNQNLHQHLLSSLPIEWLMMKMKRGTDGWLLGY
ncbi:MAG: hypothetical protein FJY10_07960 [Bacteroidetes bacterium]|nr:hypothetical protein [Bacteroidota bacterium]